MTPAIIASAILVLVLGGFAVAARPVRQPVRVTVKDRR